MGLDGGCEGGPAYCLPYAEGRTQYNPQVWGAVSRSTDLLVID